VSTVKPIIIIKKKGGHGGAHGGAWKVAYADFVTAMMAPVHRPVAAQQQPENPGSRWRLFPRSYRHRQAHGK